MFERCAHSSFHEIPLAFVNYNACSAKRLFIFGVGAMNDKIHKKLFVIFTKSENTVIRFALDIDGSVPTINKMTTTKCLGV